jgi:nickel transport protein
LPPRLACSLALAALALASTASAHTAWLEPAPGKPGAWRLLFGGHQGRLMPAVPAKLRSVTAVDAGGRELKVSRAGHGSDMLITVGGQPSMILLHYDNGVHTRTAARGPSVERPMNEVRGAVSATNAQKYHKTIVTWSPAVARPAGQPFEVVPLSAAAPRAGQPMRVQVRLQGQPAAGVNIGKGEDSLEAVTDANGVASFTPTAGFNKLWAGRRINVRGEPHFTQLSYEYLLGFEAH